MRQNLDAAVEEFTERYGRAPTPAERKSMRGRRSFSGTPTALVADPHATALKVVAHTFRADNSFLPAGFRSSTDPATRAPVRRPQAPNGSGNDA